jgi:hypothetical protein
VSVITRSALLNGAPRAIPVAMRPEFVSRALGRCVHENGVTLDFSQPGKPTANAPVDSFNDHLCDERLNVNWRLLRLIPGAGLRRGGGSARRRSSQRFGTAGALGFRLGRPDKPPKETEAHFSARPRPRGPWVDSARILKPHHRVETDKRTAVSHRCLWQRTGMGTRRCVGRCRRRRLRANIAMI